MGMTTALLAIGATAAVVGAGAGVYSAVTAKESADEANDLTMANLKAQAAERAASEVKTEQLEKEYKNSSAATASNPDLENALNLQKRKRGVQSTFTASPGSGQGMMKGTTLSPLGE